MAVLSLPDRFVFLSIISPALRRYRSSAAIILGTVLLVLAESATAANNVTGAIIRGADNAPEKSPYYLLPYGFYTEDLGSVGGVAGGVSGLPQEQSKLFATVLGSTLGARAAYLFFNDYRTPVSDRLFVDASVGIGDFPRLRGYFDLGVPSVPPAGSNESLPDNFIQVPGYTDWGELNFKYVLAAGSAKSEPLNVYTLYKGLLAGGASGGEIWNPFVSGRTTLGAKLFYYDRYYDVSGGARLTTSGVNLNLDYDNTDFPINPSKGSKLLLSLKHDPGVSGTASTWTNAEARFSKYIPLTTSERTDQRVVALSFWTADTLSTDMAPPNYGINLGGLYRMRAYPIERFYDRAAIYYSAELRVIPRSDLLRNNRLFRFLKPQWWEIVAFYERGRVAPNWDIGLLHTDMKQDIGVGLRTLISNNIARMDIAYSDEDRSILFMVGHPF